MAFRTAVAFASFLTGGGFYMLQLERKSIAG